MNKAAVRDAAIALGAFNKTLMLQMQLVNRLQQGHVPVVFVEYGPGGVSTMLRMEGGMFNEIPKQLFEPNIEKFHPFQDHFELLTDENRRKRTYLDFLREDASLNFLTFKPRNGKMVMKRPSVSSGKHPFLILNASRPIKYCPPNVLRH